MNGFNLYLKLAGAKIRSQMQYPFSLGMSIIGTFLSSFIDVIGLLVIFDRFKMIDGWTLAEICLLYGLLHIGFSIVEAVGRGFDMFGGLIRSGNFDRILVRPGSIIVHILGSEFKLSNIGRIIQGIIPFVYALSILNIVSIWQWGLIALSLLNIMIIYFALLLIQATFSFWTVEGLEVMNAFTYGGLQMGQYPLSIYQKWFAAFFTYIIPISITLYFPVLLILNKTSDIYFKYATKFTLFSTPICTIFLIIAMIFFRYGITKYKSTGS